MACVGGTPEADALCEIHSVLETNLPLLIAELAALNAKVDTLNTAIDEVKTELEEVKVQLTATETAYKEGGPKTLGDNIQDMRDIQEEGFCKARAALRRSGLGDEDGCSV